MASVFELVGAGLEGAFDPSAPERRSRIATNKARQRQYEAAERRATSVEARAVRTEERDIQSEAFEQNVKLLGEAARIGDIQKFNEIFEQVRTALDFGDEVNPEEAMSALSQGGADNATAPGGRRPAASTSSPFRDSGNVPTPASTQAYEREQDRVKLMTQRRVGRQDLAQERVDRLWEYAERDPSVLETQEAKDVFFAAGLPMPNLSQRQTAEELIGGTPQGYKRSVTTGPQGRVTGSTLSPETKGQGQQKITVEEDGVNRIKLVDSQGNVIRDMGQAPKSAALVQIGMGGQPASPTERTALAKGRASIDALDNMKSLYDNARTKTGPIVGRTSPIAGLVGMTTDEQESFMAATSAFKNQVIKDITGAQMSEVEAQRIMKQIPDIIDPPARWLAKWQQTQKNLKDIQKRSEEVLRQSGIRVPEGAATQTSEQTKSMPDLKKEIQNMTDEQLQVIMDGTEPTEQPQPPLGGDAQQLPIASNIQGQKTAKLNPEANVTAIAKSLSPQLARIVDSFKPPIRSKIWRVLAKIPISEWQNLSDTEKEQIILKARRKSTGVTGKY